MIKLKSILENVDEIQAYHGTPHNIQGGFKLQKVGSGEGSQVFGWGLYFSENPEVANAYKTGLAKYTLDGENIYDYFKKQNYPDSAMDLAHKKKITIDAAVDEWNKMVPTMLMLDYIHTYGDNAEYMLSTKHYQSSIDLLHTLEKSGRLKKQSNLYTVDIDVNLDTLLDWNEPLKSQSSYVQKHIRRILPKTKHPKILKSEPNPHTEYGGENYKWIIIAKTPYGESTFHGKDENDTLDAIEKYTKEENEKFDDKGGDYIYHYIQHRGDPKKQSWTNSLYVSSMILLKLGIPGIKYLDKFSRKLNRGTYNYVIFDESKIKIIAANGISISPKQAEQDDLIMKINSND
jgi:hypothetical protein